MKDFEKVQCERGIKIAPPGHFDHYKFITDKEKWGSFLYVYSETYSKNDKLLWNIGDGSNLCTPILVEEQGFAYLYYRRHDGHMDPICFTTVDIAAGSDDALSRLEAWWN